jgi:hypothetical protein
MAWSCPLRAARRTCFASASSPRSNKHPIKRCGDALKTAIKDECPSGHIAQLIPDLLEQYAGVGREGTTAVFSLALTESGSDSHEVVLEVSAMTGSVARFDDSRARLEPASVRGGPPTPRGAETLPVSHQLERL